MRYLSMPEAVQAVLSGEVIIYPTETFFGVGGLALDEKSILRVYQAKKRNPSEPLPVIIGHEDQLSLLVELVPGELITLLRTLWPGPLSVIFSAKREVPSALTAGSGKVAVRLTSHPAARELCLYCGPLTASSANLAGEPAPAAEELLSAQLLDACAGVLDMPPAPKGGLPSTLVELVASNTLRIVRSGAITTATLSQTGWTIAE